MNFNLEDVLKTIYGNENLRNQYLRYSNLINKFKEKFGKKEYKLFNTPGRTEISGNHTDHNHGKVIAASINLDSIAAAAKNDANKVIIYSEGYEEKFTVDLCSLDPKVNEQGNTSSLIRGVASGLKNDNLNIGGFEAIISSDVLVGSGLSSSASIEVLVGTIFNYLYNDGKILYDEIAKIGQYAENKFFGKPCGLMDQVACAAGGIVEIDFNDPAKPVIEKIDFDFQKTGYSLIVVDTGGNHADLTEDYASIPKEMKWVANKFNKEYCRDVTLEDLLANIKRLRKETNDRAVLRALHFIEENKRVDEQISALKKNQFEEFLKLVTESGNSSYKYLQNIYSNKNIEEQGVSLALALSELFMSQKGKGACRVHGGGFAGTIQVFLPQEFVEGYASFMANLFKEDSVKVLSIRNYGTICLNNIF